MKELMYSDVVEHCLRKHNFKYKKIKKTMHPFLNEQKWFLVEAEENKKVYENFWQFSYNIYKVIDSRITRVEEKTLEIPMGEVPFFYIGFGNEEQFTYLRPVRPMDSDLINWETTPVKYYILKEVYILDFDLPYTDVLKTFSATSSSPRYISEIKKNGKTIIKVVNSLCLRLPFYDYFYLNIIPEQGEKYILKTTTTSRLPFEAIKGSIEKGHYLTFSSINGVSFGYSEKEGGLIFLTIFTTTGDSFYYEKGKIKFPYRNNAIDNIFLTKIKKIIEQTLFILSKFSITYIFNLIEGGEVFCKLFDNSLLTINFERLFPSYLKLRGEISFTEYCYTKEDFLNSFQKIIKLMWEELLGEKLEFKGDFDERLKEMERRLEFLEETFSFLGK